MENSVKEIDAMSPLLELANMREKVKSTAVKKVTKNSGTTPKVSGSTKYIRAERSIQKRIVRRRVGKKFFRFRICSFLNCLFINQANIEYNKV